MILKEYFTEVIIIILQRKVCLRYSILADCTMIIISPTDTPDKITL